MIRDTTIKSFNVNYLSKIWKTVRIPVSYIIYFNSIKKAELKIKSYNSHLISLIFHSDKREQCGSLKSSGHFLYDDPLFLKGNRIVLSIDYHPNTFSFFYFFAFDICRGAVYIQSKLSSLHFIRDNVRLLITIPQSFANSQHNAHNNIIIAHFNNFKANFSSTS